MVHEIVRTDGTIEVARLEAGERVTLGWVANVALQALAGCGNGFRDRSGDSMGLAPCMKDGFLPQSFPPD